MKSKKIKKEKRWFAYIHKRLYELSADLNEAISQLTQMKEDAEKIGFTNLIIDFDYADGFDINGIREETDDEYNKRLESIKYNQHIRDLY